MGSDEGMLTIARSISELRFGGLMSLYSETNRETGRQAWPDEPEYCQLMSAEQECYRYLRDCFFTTPGAVYAVWQIDGKYVSALRLEPYRDGLLLEALETAPEERQKGYAAALIRAVQDWLREQGNVKVYSHVSKQNLASLKTHERCGFHRILEHAAYIDGSVSQSACTMCYEA